MDQLQHLVLTRLAELGTHGRPMSARQAAERSRGTVSYNTLYKLARGEHSGRLEDSTIEGIAMALDVPAVRVYEAAQAPRPEGRWQLPAKYDRIPNEHRRVFQELMAAYLAAYERGYDDGRRQRP